MNLLGKEWEVERNFQQFFQLIEKLTSFHPGMPKMPQKQTSLFSQAEDPELKKMQLNHLLHDLMESVHIMNDRDFLTFMQVTDRITDYSPIDISAASALKIEKNMITGIEQSFDGNDVMIASAKDGSTLSAIKSFMSLHFSQEIGELQVFKSSRGSGSPSPGELVEAGKIETKSRVTCMYWLESAKMVCLGLQCGAILVYYVETKITPIQFTLTWTTQVHKNPCTGIIVDLEKQLLYSISSGRRMRTLSMADGSIINGTLYLY